MTLSTLSTLSTLPTAPSRKNMEDFDDNADAFLSALQVLSEELDGWIAEFNEESRTYDEKFYSSDSTLAAAVAEIDAARSGSATLAARLTVLSDQLASLVLSQEALSTADISVCRLRSPTPDDDGYARGMMWMYDNDFWICVFVDPAHAKWRRSDGTILRRLDTPSVACDGSAATYGDVVISLSGLDEDAESIEWEFTGSPTVVEGAQGGTLQTSITVQWTSAGNYTARAKAAGDDTSRWTSDWSSQVAVVVGPSLYCGSGAYCGDGSYPGMMSA